MKLEPITDPRHPLFPQGMELYRRSFPFHEQREAASQESLFSDPDYQFNLIYDEQLWAGLLLCWETEFFIYVEHLCVFPELRNRRYGQRALETLGRREKPLILEIDPPVDDISRRRKGFYQRCGFVENPYPHIHPPYHAGHKGHPLMVLSAPSPLTEAEYRRFAHYLQSHVMAGAFL